MENIVNSTIALYKAYRKTRCGKRDNPTAMRYRMEAIERTVALSERLQRRDYSFGPYYPFKVYEPKERLVLAIDFEGKVVQHSLCDNVLEPAFSRCFIRDNYAGQIGKGTHDGLDRLAAAMRHYFFSRKAADEAARKAAVYEAALQLIARGVSPAAMTIQQLADTAGIGKGTVYGYFSSKEEILQGLAEYCFARENERIRVLFADCCTLAGLEERAVAYLQDIAANRMGDYKMIAQALDTPGKCESMPACADELRDIMRTLLIRLQAAGEIDPAVSLEYCCTAIFSAVIGGLIGLCFTAECGIQSGLPENLKMLLHRTLQVQQ